MKIFITLAIQNSLIGTTLMADIIGGLNSLTSYLRNENELRKQELLKEKQKISAQRIATGFKNISPTSSENDVRTVVYDLINDAASLDSLDANLGLINSLYADSINRIKTAKSERQDQLLADYVRQQGQEVPAGIQGGVAFDIMKWEKQAEDRVQTEDPVRGHVLKIFNPRGELKQEIVTNPMTKRQEEELKYEFTRKEIGLRSSLDNSKDVFSPVTTTEDGNLVFVTKEGYAYTQEPGPDGKPMKVPYYGKVNRISGGNAKYKDLREKQKYFVERSKTGYTNYESQATTFAAMLGIQPMVDPISKKSETNFNALFRKYGTRQGLWTAIRATAIQQGKNKEALINLYNRYQNMMENYQMNLDANYEIKVTAIEEEYGLGLDNFRAADEQVPQILSINTDTISDSLSLDEATATGKLTEWKAYQLKRAVLDTYQKKTTKRIDLKYTDPNSLWNSFSLEEKAKIFQRLTQ